MVILAKFQRDTKIYKFIASVIANARLLSSHFFLSLSRCFFLEVRQISYRSTPLTRMRMCLDQYLLKRQKREYSVLKFLFIRGYLRWIRMAEKFPKGISNGDREEVWQKRQPYTAEIRGFQVTLTYSCLGKQFWSESRSSRCRVSNHRGSTQPASSLDGQT